MGLLSQYKKVHSYKDLPTTGTYVIVTRSQKFISKAIQGFMRLFQWTRGSRNTHLSPNHADGAHNGYAIGALSRGVRRNSFDKHFQHDKPVDLWVLSPLFTKNQEKRFWLFLVAQEGEKYAYFDLVKYILRSLTFGWLGKEEPLDRDKWTCFSLVASALNFAWDSDVYPNPQYISPYEFCVITDSLKGTRFK
jgi:hypothetical protein